MTVLKSSHKLPRLPILYARLVSALFPSRERQEDNKTEVTYGHQKCSNS